ncbi:uncharacterized protein LOC116944448 isoform X2 [Petromyzon marinus]|uniref:uncharacterized protein LOC116944448 isoform X2 n=1 Tax=Petromyzon marinus TaxID=7757 RepID=UPI003F71BF3C
MEAAGPLLGSLSGREMENTIHLMKHDIDQAMQMNLSNDLTKQQHHHLRHGHVHSEDDEYPGWDSSGSDEGGTKGARDTENLAGARLQEEPCKWRYLIPDSESVCTSDGCYIQVGHSHAAFSLPKGTCGDFHGLLPQDLSSGLLGSDLRESQLNVIPSQSSHGESESREFLRQDLGASSLDCNVGLAFSGTVLANESTPGGPRPTGASACRGHHRLHCLRHHVHPHQGSRASRQQQQRRRRRPRWSVSRELACSRTLGTGGQIGHREELAQFGRRRAAPPTRSATDSDSCGELASSDSADSSAGRRSGTGAPLRFCSGGAGRSIRAIVSRGRQTTGAAVRLLMSLGAFDFANGLTVASLCFLVTLTLCLAYLWLISSHAVSCVHVKSFGKAVACSGPVPV